MNEYEKVLALYKEYQNKTSIGKYIVNAFEDNEIEWAKEGKATFPISDKSIWDFLESQWQSHDILWYFIQDLERDSMDNFNILYKTLIDENFFTEGELNLVTNINGSMVEVLNSCIYARYGYRNYEQLKGEI